MSKWIDKLTNAIQLETVNGELTKYLDDILLWIASGDSGSSYSELAEEIGDQELRQRLEEFLDRLVVGDNAVGIMFPDGLSAERSKKRYRQLIRIFHPDRGVKSEVWLNYRAEKINNAYQSHVESMSNQASFTTADVTSVKPPVGPKSNSSSITKFKYRPSVWRERLGSPQEFQRKVLSILVLLSLFVILIIFWGGRQSDISRNTISEMPFKLDDRSTKLKSNHGSVGDYVLNLEAQSILEEADRLIAEGGVISAEAGNYNIADELDLVDEVISGKEVSKELNKGGVTPRASKSGEVSDELIEKLPAYVGVCSQADGYIEVDTQREILVRLNVRSGPSIDCSLLTTLSPVVNVQFSAKSLNDKWTKILYGESLSVGWVNTQMLMSSPDIKVRKPVSRKVVSKKTNIQTSQLPKYKVKDQVESAEVFNKPLKSDSLPVFFTVVEKLKKYYESGDSDAMAELYITSGRENEIRGADKIRKHYRKAFSKTTEREFKYQITSYKQEDELTAVVKGNLNVTATRKKKSKVIKINAEYRIVMLKVDDDYRIVAFEWSAI